MPPTLLEPYDAVVLVSFGGPEGMDEVMPFLRRVTAGRGVPDDRLAEVAEHYALFGGVSPINAQNKALVAALDTELRSRGIDTPIHLANRNSEPYIADVLAELAPARLLAIFTSPYQSYSSCRQYREDLGTGAAGLDIAIDKLPPYAEHPAWTDPVTRLVVDAVRQAHAEAPDEPLALVCVAHSIPTVADDASGPPAAGSSAYYRGLSAMTERVTAAANDTLGLHLPADLAWCSRSGPPQVPWLEPDINDRLAALAAAGVRSVVVAPIGFVSDHLEVAYDLDTEARDRARELGLRFHRAPTPGTDPQFVAGLADLALARAAAARGEAAPELDALPPADCPADCCRSQRPPRPTVCGREDPQ